ncbi:hypothetical protein BC939DRAFT_111125 [Gamsiella multidivaricata]|uniref:uncharacterized protein n=1 Tax=Gamsiella multidivaricata TaxID=101098 RepID=UPI002220B7B1|nr:uncharacterized protein BC939DRAFT_111125 [Gamsiella multidivaricata]KAI7826485.1 hypothetical protein BC939DRAFT_111125 [Gamsiella multidivaricata]
MSTIFLFRSFSLSLSLSLSGSGYRQSSTRSLFGCVAHCRQTLLPLMAYFINYFFLCVQLSGRYFLVLYRPSSQVNYTIEENIPGISRWRRRNFPPSPPTDTRDAGGGIVARYPMEAVHSGPSNVCFII